MADFNYSDIDKILEKYEFSKRSIFPILRDIQDIFNFVPREIFPYVAEKLCVGEDLLYGVVENYKFLSLEPKGKYVIKVCDGTLCHIKHSCEILKLIREKLGLSEEKTTTDDRKFTLETVHCLGVCGNAPSVSINGKIYTSVTAEEISLLINELRG